MSENSKIDNIKHYDSPDENNGKNIDEISSPDIRAFPKKNNVVNKLQRCKTLAAKDNISKRNNLTFINKKYTEKSYSINSKPLSLLNPNLESNFPISNKRINIDSEMAIHSEIYNQSLYFLINNNNNNTEENIQQNENKEKDIKVFL